MGCGGVRPHPPSRPSEKIQGLLISNIVRTADSTIIIITNLYLAAGSHEIFLRVGGREGMKGIGAFQRHQLPHPPCKNPASATGYNYSSMVSTTTSTSGPIPAIQHMMITSVVPCTASPSFTKIRPHNVFAVPR